jgi:hypothetical protein
LHGTPGAAAKERSREGGEPFLERGTEEGDGRQVEKAVDRQSRRDRGEDVSDTDEEEEEEEEGEFEDDDSSVAWDVLVGEVEPMGGDFS